MTSDLKLIDWMARDTAHRNKKAEHHKCLHEPRHGALFGGDHQEFYRSFNNDSNPSKHGKLCKSGAQGLPHESVMELEINFQNLSQEGSQQTLLRNACLREHFIKNQSCCKECNNEPKDIEEIISVLSDDIHVSSADPQPIRYDGSKSLVVCDNQSKKISTYTCQSEVNQLAPAVRGDTSDSKDNEFLINALHLPKGCCGACGKDIIGQVLIALGKMWHLDHFTCHQCGIQLGTNIFYEAEGRAYCENDYINTFSPKCATCDEPILEKCISALNKLWHPHHFLCCYCNQRCDEEGYHEINGLAYCSQDFYNIFAQKCFGCGEAIVEGYITALNHQWHVTCFVCFECKEPFTSGSFYDHGGQPFCEHHFNVLKKGFCVACNQMIIGPSITALGKKYHPDHFTCTFCLQIIYKGTFREHENKPYCHQCSDRLFS